MSSDFELGVEFDAEGRSVGQEGPATVTFGEKTGNAPLTVADFTDEDFAAYRGAQPEPESP
ncbi:MAG: hypothetical protein KDI13_04635 [Alphaproteobacteria bacterium]|nr:hypothetical protein [Alphaproteobacteria bacterium]